VKLLNKHTLLPSLSAVLILIFAGIFAISMGCDTPLLFSEQGASWIYADRAFVMEAQREGEHVSYRRRFGVEQAPPPATLIVRALGNPDVYLDGRRIQPVKSDAARWKQTLTFELAGVLAPGMHEIYIRVFNRNGPAVLLAYGAQLQLATGPEWEASYDELLWTKAVPAEKKQDPELAAHFVSTGKAFTSLLPLYVCLFLAVFFLTLKTSSQNRMEGIKKIIGTPSRVRWLLLALWGILAVNNIFKVPLDIGMDAQEHYEYMEFVADTGRIPLATQGWQMFQSPLYYVISAIVWSVPLTQSFDTTHAMMLLRFIPLLCGLLQVELAYRAGRYVFPNRQDLQIWGIIIGGLLPMNLYISQAVGNEPLSGLLSACAVVVGLHLLVSKDDVVPDRYFIFLGVALGLALLTKVTAVLLVPMAVLVVIHVLLKRRQSVRYITLRILLVIGTIFVISGWYYIRNWMELGRPFVGGWESTTWWQDPGYRTVADFLAFGRSLSSPIYAAVQGFWDSLYSTLWLDGGLSGIGVYKYRPPWNYDFMLSGTLLSLVPTAGLLIGILTTLFRPSSGAYEAQLLSVFCLAIFVSALLYLYVTVPVWSTAKATYSLGITPCYAIVCVTGLDVLSRNDLLRAAINGCLACWAVSSYCSYFVV
jgi:sorbitol-specific phosphotransferase system component IIC